MVVRRFVKDGICRACAKNFHTRCRVLLHLQWSGTKCWLYHLRSYHPMTEQEAQQWDDEDRRLGRAIHQRELGNAVVDKMWAHATPQELKPVLSCMVSEGERLADPTQAEIDLWSSWGSLPPGFDGKERTNRKITEWKLHNLARDIPHQEQQLKRRLVAWVPNHDWVPRPLAEGVKYFLNFFSGHRRFGDVGSWFNWDGRVVPISIDLAVDSQFGDVLRTDFWYSLIMARKVVGGHGGPPCETYTAARWNQVEGQICPRPLRDAEQPWGRFFLTLREQCQCFTGTVLMLATLKLLVMIFVHGGSITLEHPAGDGDPKKWCIWSSAFIKWLLLDGQIQTVTFLQGPLGQAFAKPTTMLTGRLPNLAALLYASYSKRWRATEVLCGRQGGTWRTAKAKAYPERMSMVIAQAHLQHFEVVMEDGVEPDPIGLQEVLAKLAKLHDPYDIWAEGTVMMPDYHGKHV